MRHYLCFQPEISIQWNVLIEIVMINFVVFELVRWSNGRCRLRFMWLSMQFIFIIYLFIYLLVMDSTNEIFPSENHTNWMKNLLWEFLWFCLRLFSALPLCGKYFLFLRMLNEWNFLNYFICAFSNKISRIWPDQQSLTSF